VELDLECINGVLDLLFGESLELTGRAALLGEGNDPLLNLERRAYLEVLAAACSGLESARVVLVKARQRIEREAVP
jgi:hypothetical protein